MRKSFVIFSYVAIAFVAGAAGGFWFHSYMLATVPEAWYEVAEIPLSGPNSGLGFTTEALFQSEIPLPPVKGASARMKFRPANDRPNELTVGYVINVEVEKLEPRKIPAKYKKARTEKTAGGEFTFDPLSEVSYAMHVSFDLLDKDGFALVKLEGPTHYLLSGQRNSFQEIVQQPVPLDVARRTARIVPRISIDKCESCR